MKGRGLDSYYSRLGYAGCGCCLFVLGVKVMTDGLLAADEVERIGLEFIKGTYYRGEVTISQSSNI